MDVSSGRYIEVDYVRAKILDSGKCVKNGVIYQISMVLGAASRLILQELTENVMLRWVMYSKVLNYSRECLKG